MTSLPYSDHCFVCGCHNQAGVGLRFHKGEGGVWAEITLDERHQGYPGVAHGGVVAAILDECIAWSATLETDRFAVTVELKIRYLKSVKIGEPIRVRARNVKSTNRLHQGVGEICSASGEVLVKAEGKFVPLSAQQTAKVDAQLIYDEDQEHMFGL